MKSSNQRQIRCVSVAARLTEEMLVWLAIIRPLTRWAEGRYGDFLDNATWMLAGPQGMKLASLRSRILWRLLCT